MPDHAISDDPAVQRQLDRLSLLSPGRDVLGLGRISQLLDRLDNPQKQLPPALHIAGTNGKGSTCAFLRAAIEAAGLTTHVYTSPHLVRFNERIRIAGRLIEDDLLAALLEEVIDIAEGLDASFFEVTTAVAFLAFARHPADAAIIEVGLGGRLDATNVLTAPLITAITHLGLDHEAFLLAPEDNVPTEPMARIGFEKAGIAKQGVPLVVQAFGEPADGAVTAQAERAGASLLARGKDWGATSYDGQLHYRDAAGKLTLPLPKLTGAHQQENAALAVAILRHQKALTISEPALAAAMDWAHWPARLHRLGNGPLTRNAVQAEIWIDGGHNPLAAQQLAVWLKQQREKAPDREIHLILGMLANKDATVMVESLAPHIDRFTAIPVQGHECHAPDALVAMAEDAHIGKAGAAQDVTEALEGVGQQLVLIAGSLYLAGKVLKQNEEVPA
ncbi:bifunctional folylpolyglutamate synthase/dihydrofolate synthase [Alterisphingorhabdus coralli]|uniref:Dihydrofolate synthase/folylpolyglutamate synthase n=1 Tax=Alterisphingorhabdus coralli TaxID=3071408 RepID=A0AA97F7A4_9SPHN|nr:folylpolyglutamate synthase/dihydrofolate synthase family protein [Parasphingorhabdus sp. SCSIO 66989]WOE73840.1 folylpolyglutamate synthase/dihydrofolate synthase family protein [Parasphingorhabdus sp. SCSIO 66989]